MKKFKLILICLTLLVGTSLTALAETIMIVNPNNPVSEATSQEIANFFLGKSTQWSNGLKVIPIDQKKAGDDGKAFLSKIIKMSESNYKNMWVEKMLSGEADPPTMKGSDDDVIKYVIENPGAIGYISASSLTDGVKVLKIDGKKQW